MRALGAARMCDVAALESGPERRASALLPASLAIPATHRADGGHVRHVVLVTFAEVADDAHSRLACRGATLELVAQELPAVGAGLAGLRRSRRAASAAEPVAMRRECLAPLRREAVRGLPGALDGDREVPAASHRLERPGGMDRAEMHRDVVVQVHFDDGQPRLQLADEAELPLRRQLAVLVSADRHVASVPRGRVTGSAQSSVAPCQ